MKFTLLFLFFCDSETVTCSVLFTSGKAVQLTWYEFSTYLPSLVTTTYSGVVLIR